MVMMLLSDQELMDIDAGGWEWRTRLDTRDRSSTFGTERIWVYEPKPVPGRC